MKLTATAARGQPSSARRRLLPNTFRTEALHIRILVCLKDRLQACFSNALSEIFRLHIAPRKRSNLQKECLDPPHHLNRGSEKHRCALAGILKVINEKIVRNISTDEYLGIRAHDKYLRERLNHAVLI